ncbi:hypothetical protein KBY58_03600 [Cyanobium sp. HWJ4-Hawea]|uniref:hypothetical protein n=1 Tax=Cyanobium sp. HWJ4-Hawea TaxID=2823713 RepID=UPI0020CFD66C|nr:hypothetical protein [Cyanobium sp. HWJ4-Hawea]MCP9808515.1 hypothetical protein [Cyanobium sp. HWJ4-Hawea]
MLGLIFRSLVAAALPLPLVLLVAPQLAVLPAGAAELKAPGPQSCPLPKPGRYVLMGEGQKGVQPLAELAQEQWLPGGRIEGVRYSRLGQGFEEETYGATYSSMPGCWLSIKPVGRSSRRPLQVALDRTGRPKVAIGTEAGVVFSAQYVEQSDESCGWKQLDGLVISVQRGNSLQAGRWQPNAVIQREVWNGGQVRGKAVSSYAGKSDVVGYTGTMELAPNCLAKVREVDAAGRVYNYRAIVLASGRGYFYLQTDPTDLTLGYLARQR